MKMATGFKFLTIKQISTMCYLIVDDCSDVLCNFYNRTKHRVKGSFD